MPSKQNVIADAISRSQWGRFRQAATEAQQCPVKVPSLEHLAGIAKDLIFKSTSNNIKNTYSDALGRLYVFRELYNLLNRWPVPDQDLLNFIAYLAAKKCQLQQ
ncbi:hypothetical protein DPMN_062283 [Dreissena polymorpha]|uniref:Uncharacterized protein n=1 Tax=Dreissena polymorpha TaxID=45954 RepID=A0A9D4HJ88_DREPO|nr:hypothetical protein DPMN_062283 [Dreissena polymorpha]